MSGGNSEPLYNTDTLNKACISTRILTSPQRYSVMRSRVPRLRESGIRAPLADYDTDTAHKKYLTSSVRDSRIRYAATFSNSSKHLPPSQDTSSAGRCADRPSDAPLMRRLRCGASAVEARECH